MSRCFVHIHRRKVDAYGHSPVFTSSRSASSIPHSRHDPLFFKPISNPLPPSSIPLQILVDQYKSSQLHSNPVQRDEKVESLTRRYRDSCCPKDADEFHLQVFKNGFVNDLFLCNTLINVYARVGDLGSARKVFDEMLLRNSVTWSCLISGYTQNRMPNEACGLFMRMVADDFMPNHYSFSSAIRACQDCGEYGLKFGMQIHGLMSKTQYCADVTTSNVLISMYGSVVGMVDYARRVFDSIWPRNLISWNSMISVYCQRGDAISAFEIFSTVQKEVMGDRLRPNEYTFGSLISATISFVDSGLTLLKQMLSMVEKSGFSHDLYVGSALVSGFAKFGLISYAKDIFQRMSYRNAVSMNGLIIGLVRQSRGEEAVELFAEMKDSVEINLDSYVILLTAFPEFCVLEDGKRKGSEVHAYLIRTGLLNAKIAIGNGLINMYAKCGAINDASTVFRLMDNKDSVTWNSMITGLDQNEHFLDAVETFQDMRRTGLFPSNFTMISALSSSASLGWIRVGEQLHCEGLKLGLDLDVSVSNALLALYGETGYVEECQKAFSLMLEYDQVSWNSLIGALADSESSLLEAVENFLVMMRAGWRPNRVTFISILAAVSSLSLHALGKQIHGLVLKHNVAADTAIENALLACYGKCGDMRDCENIFSRMSNRRDEVSWNSMISGYIHNELLPKAMDMVWFMTQRGQRLDGFTFATVLSACATIATLECGMEVHGCSIRACLESDVVVGSALVDMYAKCGRIDYASRFFELMPARNLYSWNSMISGYSRHGHGRKALDLFARMKLHGPLPDHVTFVGVLSACSHVGLVNEGFRHFDSMSEVYGLAPRMEHFSCMVDLLGRAGELNRVEDFLNKMPVKPNILIWRTVLGACSRANGRNTALGRRAAEMLLEMEPRNAVNYVLLSNMYASGGKWEDVAKTRVAMRKAFVKKEAGCSWVTMKDGVHVFVAGDKSHPEKDLIYEKLKELNTKMRQAGYVPETRFALYDLEGENKEELLSYHSEKIAVAFVLTRPSKMPIRIMKNLRVCGDCHSAFKYISEIVGRQIVLRDSNRFHHFENGQCSCGDYW
ncbi:putative pentatricopeptide repeat-containing protein At5g09950 [Cucurbita pepo subsp. pepo]|uniref:putative pentatricopeptide repeat-containing protein At5g09950 n=1 Tax=Cucurbita pepo subsp. pepo TaxID=3664 RepID=UPI000C9D6333|nr:putative pentatricopeptide repeat-containing protein At5g09950 [Cucurbita pepo subsp. pepo]XP_023529591.1 putative pentatricopeptide repeat-containing protein At5g09950 [Cucurbita pepo subsp. pepo]XP_023529592.1 putative pentatricopeptide repeat-containing protein At5g09950 [Cucurbita pepo subsp. pepo]